MTSSNIEHISSAACIAVIAMCIAWATVKLEQIRSGRK